MSSTRYFNKFALIILLICSCRAVTPDSEALNDSPNKQRMLTEKEFELFSQLLSPNDSTLQQETKQLLAQYLVAQTLADVEKKQGQVQTGGVAVAVTSTSRPSVAIPAVSRAPASTTTAVPTTPRVTVAPEHVLNQVDKILGNVASGNVVGIVDESLAIRAPDPVRNLVGGILQLVFCNPLDRLFNRCRQQPASNAAKNTASLTPNIDRLTNRLTGNNKPAASSSPGRTGSGSGNRVATPNIDRLTSRLTGNNRPNSNSGSNLLFG